MSDIAIDIVTPEPAIAPDDLAVASAFTAQQRAEEMHRRAPPPPQPELPPEAKAWLKEHPEFLTDAVKLDKLGKAHNYLTDVKGVPAFSKNYFDAINSEFGLAASRQEMPAPAFEPPPTLPPIRRQTPIMTAPVSRDVPMTSGQRMPTSVTLTAEERLIARNSWGPDAQGKDLTDAEKEYLYAQNKSRMLRMKANGEIGGEGQ